MEQDATDRLFLRASFSVDSLGTSLDTSLVAVCCKYESDSQLELSNVIFVAFFPKRA